MDVVYSIAVVAQLAFIAYLVMQLMDKQKTLIEAQHALQNAQEVLADMQDTVNKIQAYVAVEDEGLAKIALKHVERLDPEDQSGEWKFHQAYAAILKDPAAKDFEKWKIGLAIQQAVAHIRTRTA